MAGLQASASRPDGRRHQNGFGYETYKGFDGIIHANTTGNRTKSLNLSLEASLEKLQTHYIDIMFVHWWDLTTSIPELMHSLNTV